MCSQFYISHLCIYVIDIVYVDCSSQARFSVQGLTLTHSHYIPIVTRIPMSKVQKAMHLQWKYTFNIPFFVQCLLYVSCLKLPKKVTIPAAIQFHIPWKLRHYTPMIKIVDTSSTSLNTCHMYIHIFFVIYEFWVQICMNRVCQSASVDWHIFDVVCVVFIIFDLWRDLGLHLSCFASVHVSIVSLNIIIMFISFALTAKTIAQKLRNVLF